MKRYYDMECPKCGHEFELYCTMEIYSEGGPHKCPSCGSIRTRRNWGAKSKVTVVDNTGTRKGYYNSKEGYHR